ncbi:MAG: ABC transporter ATP-binding protein [Rhodospirillales bacterium]|nr:ABC transporter ATP-binding protein [Rhodospirillales bacterium]
MNALAYTPLLSVENLTVGFRTEGGGEVRVVEEVSFEVGAGEMVGLVGESGCGKSVTAMSILKLLPMPPAFIAGGCVLFENENLVALDEEAMRRLRGDRIGMIFQEPMTSLNPTFTIGYQLDEVLTTHRPVSARAARARSIELLRKVGVGAPETRCAQYPHQLSGGLRQRVMIAMALACEPKLLIADEPTTALDVTIQAQILDLLKRLQGELGMAVLLITHDLGVVAEFCSRVMVMYAGRVVETGPARRLFRTPRHAYTAGLLASMPRLSKGKDRLATIPGMVPSPEARGGACAFADRCPRVLRRCREEMPRLAPMENADHRAACWNPVPS